MSALSGRSTAGALRVTLIEPWFGGSHRAFAERWAALSQHRVTVHGLSPRHWKWRQEASAWELARALESVDVPDVLVVSDYVDLPRLVGFLPPAWRGVPTLAYFHENQLTYPGHERDRAYGFSNVLTAIRADGLAFNSEFHRAEFAGAGDALLARLPRPNPRAEFAAALRRAHVIAPLPSVGDVPLGPGRPPGAPLRVLFPHRLEDDKDPLAFLAMLEEIAREHRVEAVLTSGETGAAREEVHAALARATARGLIVHAGHVPDRARYLEWLGTTDVVISTARHEFFGVAVVEGMAAGALPILPQRLAYPEVIGGAVLPAGTGIVSDLGAALRSAAEDPDRLRSPAARAAARAAVAGLEAGPLRALDALAASLAARRAPS